MSKKRQSSRLRDVWVNQTELGRHFGISAVAVGKKLAEFGLRNEQKEPSELPNSPAESWDLHSSRD